MGIAKDYLWNKTRGLKVGNAHLSCNCVHLLTNVLSISTLLTANQPAIILLLAANLDYLIGDPWGWPHPVRVMGWVISHFTEFVLKQFSNQQLRRLAGILLGIGLIIGSGVAGWLIVQAASLVHPLVSVAVESILLASCFAAKSLRMAALEVLQPLTTGNLAQARTILSQYVGRDTAKLDEPEILRAVLETVTENATDGVTAPLFYAIVGAFLPIGSIPLALAYKAASTLDSMVGYRSEPYTDLGWFSAKFEDLLTGLPCRLTVITLAILSGKPLEVWHICSRDANKDPSPNSGWSECAYAAILGVQVGGTNWYQGLAKDKPLLGNPVHPITTETIYQALGLTRYCFLMWLSVGIFAIFCRSLLVFAS